MSRHKIREFAEWQPIETAPENMIVMTKIDDAKGARNEAELIRHGRLWWIAKGKPAMYVYYEPTHWKVREGLKKP
jgi:hypothetical protein